MLIDLSTAGKLLSKHDDIVILAHQKPDGDTLGGTFALMWALQSLGKRARVECADGFSARYGFLYGEYEPDRSFEPAYVVSVDIAGTDLIGPLGTPYADRVDLCIDHHKSNSLYARYTLLDIEAPAVCQTVCEIIERMGAVIDKRIADAIFTGLATDTGCFRYSNVTAKCHMTAAKMIECGADHAKINKLMFDTRSRGMLMVERMMIETTTFYCGDRCAMAVLPVDVTEKFGVAEDDLDGVSSFTARIEGVLVGITVRVKPGGTYRVSVRTASRIDASRICSAFGGGGHTNAAGCTIDGELYDVIDRLLAAVQNEFDRYGLS